MRLKLKGLHFIDEKLKVPENIYLQTDSHFWWFLGKGKIKIVKFEYPVRWKLSLDWFLTEFKYIRCLY